MADERPAEEIKIGSLTLREGYGGSEKIAIYQASGEGGDFPTSEIEALLQAYYREHF